MKTTKTLRVFSVVLLIFLGIGAVYGGGTLVIDPSGELLGLPLSVLNDSPFGDFMIPGLILLLFLGFLSFVIMFMTIKKYSNYEY